VLPAALASAAIDYEHIAALGGLRGRMTGIPPAVNAFWTNRSFHNYADYAMGEEFRAAIARLRARGRARRCVTGAPFRRRSRKRTYTYVLRSMRTLRFTLVARAGRLARIGGRHVLRLTFNPATAALYTKLEQRLVT
jgi:hypothetical protein